MTTWRTTGPDLAQVDPRPVADSLDRVTRALGAPHARSLATLFSRWEAVVGPEIAQHAEPRSVRDGVLVLVVDQPAWATQLRYLVPELLARIRAGVSQSGVTEVQIRVAGGAGLGGGIARSGRRGDGSPKASEEGGAGRRSHPPLVEWKHPGSGR
jgi:predicted nucleic acid-binding Zn ribbon protein